MVLAAVPEAPPLGGRDRDLRQVVVQQGGSGEGDGVGDGRAGEVVAAAAAVGVVVFSLFRFFQKEKKTFAEFSKKKKKKVEEFFQTTPELERMLLRSGIVLVKYWFSVSDEEQEKRFRDRIDNESKRWKLSPMDPFARSKWVDYAKAKDAMFAATSTPESPWWTVPSDDKKAAQLNCLSHLLSLIKYEIVPQEAPLALPPSQEADGYVRPPIDSQHVVPQKFKPKEETKEGQ